MEESTLIKTLIFVGIICISTITILQYRMISLGGDIKTSALLFKICSKDGGNNLENKTNGYTCRDLKEMEIETNKIDCKIFENNDEVNSCREIKDYLEKSLEKCNEAETPLSEINQDILSYKEIKSDCDTIFNK